MTKTYIGIQILSMKKNLHTDIIGDRLKQYRLSKGFNVVDFSKILSISQGSLSGLENNKSKPSADTLANLVLYTDIDIKWLLTGESELKASSNSDVVQYEHPVEAQYMKLIKEFKNKGLALELNMELVSFEQDDPALLYEIKGYFKRMKSEEKKAKDHMTRSGEGRRKNKAS